MTQAEVLTEIWRGDFLESQHMGHAVVCDSAGEIVESWGDPEKVVLPRSSSKMIQALPLIESGAADAAGLSTEQLALACASHNGAHIHTDRVARWLADLGLADDDLRCGPEMPSDPPTMKELLCSDSQPCQCHNNCSGKHTGFLTLTRHLGAGAEYIDPTHPVQQAVREAFEEVTGQDSPGFAIDGCSAPNFATTMHGMARAMGAFAGARAGQGRRADAAVRLREAMALHPELVAGEGRACTELMRAMGGAASIKTGAEAFFVAMLPEQKLGMAVKIEDGGTRAAECTIAALLVRFGVLKADHPATAKRMNAAVKNWRDVVTGSIRPAATLAR
ncbi:asparaginase [Aliiroseovarius subalbicans]|uniref:asparaginase n=1 Tax=Aliiroseovarius subalbicans TaxID=2925840 RepID=UPI001F597ED5|nr:asparaginase [Aliiroseovarius subalbicans]MCI2399865.1 asparaginase [Aliiroseovarius subalbicans]